MLPTLGDHLSRNDHLAGDLLIVLLPALAGLCAGFLTAATLVRVDRRRIAHPTLTPVLVGTALAAAVFVAFFLGQSDLWAERWHDAFVD